MMRNVPGQLRGAVVVITGASSGIGEATAEAFAAKGARLVLAARDASALQAVAKSCRDKGCDVLVAPTDVTDAAAVKNLAAKAMSFGSIDVWVSNVGVGAVGRFHETPVEAHEQTIRANLIGHLNDAHAVLPMFLEQGEGVFINVISIGGFVAAPFAAAYSASKFGLRGFSESLRAELADYPGIHICDIYPSFVDTPGIGHGANYVGRKLTAPPPIIDARRVARTIVNIARWPRPTTTVGVMTNAARLAHLIAPNFSTRMAGRLMRAYFERAPRVQMSNGNLYRPPSVPGGIDGGLRSSNATMAPALAVAGLALVGLTCALAMWQWSNHRSTRRYLW
ncbi:SDR family oxidoreductase [Rhizobium sp. BR 362]|uniref:SDR family oxidoreductase n=1 Tax=Rhizobium sp. BR 362 TaxID=3040670 RepID=UPI002F3FD3F6